MSLDRIALFRSALAEYPDGTAIADAIAAEYGQQVVTPDTMRLLVRDIFGAAVSASRAALEYVTHRSACGHGYHDVVHVSPAHFDGPACPQCSDAEYANRMQREDPCPVCAILATSPQTPQDGPGRAEGSEAVG